MKDSQGALVNRLSPWRESSPGGLSQKVKSAWWVNYAVSEIAEPEVETPTNVFKGLRQIL